MYLESYSKDKVKLNDGRNVWRINCKSFVNGVKMIKQQTSVQGAKADFVEKKHLIKATFRW